MLLWLENVLKLTVAQLTVARLDQIMVEMVSSKADESLWATVHG